MSHYPTVGESSFSAALEAWRHALGETRVWEHRSELRRYLASTTGVQRRVLAVLRPGRGSDVVSVVRIAREHRIPLYPISTGRNWGYGAANPVVNDCVIVDLSAMDRIVEMDDESGLVTVEPGVTQQQLRDFLDERHAPYYVPVHGGGPDCSLLGNALERGYGITPYADHFGALTALEAVLPDGTIYRQALEEMGGREVNRAFKWGIGPYLDGLFTQGALGIVTQGTIALAPAASNVHAFLFALRDEQCLEPVVVAVRDVLRELGTLCGSINLMNALRVLSMIAPYPHDRVKPGEPISDALLRELTREHDVASWTGAGALYGDARLIRAAAKVIRRRLKPYVRQMVFFDAARLRRWDRWLGLVPLSKIQNIRSKIASAAELLAITSGAPRRTALRLAYWKSGVQPPSPTDLNPARDGCGLMWYSPLVPMKPPLVRQYVDSVTEVCRSRELDPLITLTSLSDKAFDSTVPLLFQRDDEEAIRRARQCYDDLFERGRAHGFLPYRVGVDQMAKIVDPKAPCWRLAQKIKQAIDPHDLIAPGRYVPTDRSPCDHAASGPMDHAIRGRSE